MESANKLVSIHTTNSRTSWKYSSTDS